METVWIDALFSLDDSPGVLCTAAREEVPSLANKRLDIEAVEECKRFGTLSCRGQCPPPTCKDFVVEAKRLAEGGVYQVIVTKFARRVEALRWRCPHGG